MDVTPLLCLLIALATADAGSDVTIQEARFPAQLKSALGTAPCRVGGERELNHGQQIEREDPCEFCICIDSNVFCWWGQQHCSNNINNSTVDNSTVGDTSIFTEPVEATEGNVTLVEASSTSSTTVTTCIVMGRQYDLGAVLPRDTGTCLECVCAQGGRVTCSPKDCVRPSGEFHNSDPGNSLDMFDVDVF